MHSCWILDRSWFGVWQRHYCSFAFPLQPGLVEMTFYLKTSENGPFQTLLTFIFDALSGSLVRQALLLPLCPDAYFLPQSPCWCVPFVYLYIRPPSQRTSFLTLTSLTHPHPVSISFSVSAFPVISVGGKRISRRKRGSKALNDDTEFWINKFRPLTPSEKWSYSSSPYKMIIMLNSFPNDSNIIKKPTAFKV